jgi:2-C-methyl-D-erythritol 4-phosphate cytidylyltransferase
VNVLAILVAAGRGERLAASRPKAFVEVGGRAMLLRAAQAFAAASSVDAIASVVPEALVDEARLLLAGVAKPCLVCAGGPRRQDSVREGLRLAPDGFDGVVLVHDAARPFVTPETIEAVIRAARETGAAVPVLMLTETVKRVRDGRVVGTLDRSELAGAQTPQGFRSTLLARAYEAAFRERVTLTDEAMAVERLGSPVAAVPGSASNRKLTTPEDLQWAEMWLARAGGCA